MPARVILGVGAGIAAYKVCELLRLLTESGHEVRVVPTADSLHFVGAATWAALSGQPVTTSSWDDVQEVPHVRLGQAADLVLVAPATADLLARAAAGRADDLLTSVLLIARCPVVFAPAMHTEMWEHPATQANVATLRGRGCLVLDPASGRLTGPDIGPGRLPQPGELWRVAVRVLARGPSALAQDLAGRRVVVSAGGTREEIDPVRFLGNWSSGKQGYALARAAVTRGAQVALIAANVEAPDPAGATVTRVTSACQMRSAVLSAAAGADAVVMAAAVADYRPEARSDEKIKKTGMSAAPLGGVVGSGPAERGVVGSGPAERGVVGSGPAERGVVGSGPAERGMVGSGPAERGMVGSELALRLVENPDILRELSVRREPGQIIAGFAAETGNLLDNGRAKLAAKGCDLLVVNQVGPGVAFGTSDNAAVVLAADGAVTEVPRGPKEVLADVVWDMVLARLPVRP
jgi:phosphopantothenoylcysteine decarboxylase/phosphopantothenate--cysteine ligase